ncbi:MAG: hypothetical protein ONB25_14250 [candidate division KSB1 bacterium]|nr:hypothetical protein [candidate division KSB1 bacterium]MDZ7394046.1 hypothetical protein [candidate division KSB1 bacterium]
MWVLDDNFFRAVRFEHPEVIPADVYILPATWSRHREALAELVQEYPALFGDYKPGSIDFDAYEGTYNAGRHVDAWGCVWENIAPGLEGLVVGHPLPRREDVRSFETPPPGAGLPHGFMYMRLYYLRGYEELMVDFAEEPPELQMLIDKVLAYNLQELETILADKPAIYYFGDDLGDQHRLPIHPDKWNRYLKPCYQQIFARCREAGTIGYFHTDGHIVEIIDSLIDCGIDVLNPQVGANGLSNIARLAKGKVAICLDLDRQRFPFWTAEHIDRHVREAVEALYLPEGGLLLQASVGPELSLGTIRAICESLERYRFFR